MQLAAAWVLFQAVLGLGGGPASFRRFGLATAANAALLALFAMVQSLTWSGKIYGIRPTLHTNGWMTGGPFVCHSHLAAYLNIGLGFALGLLLSSRVPGAGHRWGSRRDLGSRLWSCLCRGPDRGRRHRLALAGRLPGDDDRGRGDGVLPGSRVRPARERPRRHARAGRLVPGRPGQHLALPAAGDDPGRGHTGFDGRVEIWGAAIQAWRVHPLWGTGLGSFPASTAPYFEHDHGVFYSHSEDEYVQMLVEGGVVGLGLALLALASIARLGLRAWVAAASPHARALVLGGLFGGLALAVQSLSDFPLHIPGVAVTAVILCATSAGWASRPAGPAPIRGRWRRGPFPPAWSTSP